MLPIRTQNGLVFPLEGRSYCAAPEIIAALQLGADITIRHGVVVPTTDNLRIFGDFIADCLKRRSDYPKKSIDALFWKEISNATYGKTAQGLREKRVFDMREEATRPLAPSQITNPFFASYITSFVRGVLGEIINSLPANVMVFSCTTDGFITDANDEQVRESESGTLSAIFATSRGLLTGIPSVLEKKHQIRLPLGWRTRGQATLKSGPDNAEDLSYGTILAKAGISLSDEYETIQDSVSQFGLSFVQSLLAFARLAIVEVTLRFVSARDGPVDLARRPLAALMERVRECQLAEWWKDGGY